jgi:hypothetical protein
MQDVQAAGAHKGALRPDINFGKIPLYFVANKGQVNEKALFYAKASRYTLWLTKEGLVFDSTHPAPSGHPSQEGNYEHPYSPRLTKIDRDVSRFFFLNANKNPEIVPLEESKLRVNYFKGKDKSKWHCDIPTSQAVLYKSLYKNIDLKVYGIEKEIEYDWIVKPDGNPKDIRFEYKNVKGTRLDEAGNLLIETDFGQLMHKRPVSYQRSTAQSTDVGAGSQTCPQERKDVKVTFKKITENTYGFEVGEYDKSRELIIDPVVLAYSTYLGGTYYDSGRGIAVDDSGCVYVTGHTDSLDFPTLNEYQGFHPSVYSFIDVFITKLDTTKNGASSLIYSTYLGGESVDYGYGIAVDGSGCAYITGETWSSDFPTRNQYQAKLRGERDIFITKLDTAKSGTSSLIYSTYLGGEGRDYGYGIAVDGTGSAYVTGGTWSSDFPTRNPYQASHGGHDFDAFIAKVDTTKNGASSFIYSTYLGGELDELGYGIAVDGTGCAYITGLTESSNFPTLNEYQTYQGSSSYYNAFITKLVLCSEEPSIQLNRGTLYFAAVSGGSQTGFQTFLVDISGGCSMPWTASCDETWIEVTPKSAAGSALATVGVNTAGLAAGTYTGAIFITYGSASDSVTVNLTIYDATSTSVPFGEFSTPLDDSVARGSIPVTGWVLDDMEVESVKIYRDGNIYVGDAVFVDGARPDVEAAFPTYPFNYRAGWGYMLLTNFLPNGGNGIHTLYASATDVEGNSVTLGAKTIVCDNANAVKPFGTIDTPAQGGTASGFGYINWGWVLTPQPNSIPFDGSTIHVWVDGVNIGDPVYNIFRSDIAALFPGYANSNGASGYFYLDTTAYANGVHTIQWTVTDNGGNTDGIGSRYFNIQNSGSSAMMLNVQSVRHWLLNIDPGQLPIDDSNPVTVKKGSGWNMEPQKLSPGDNGIITVETRELERMVIHLAGNSTPGTTRMDSPPPALPTDSYIYLNTGGRLRPLPIGSTFDGERDIFYWQPGPGFIGEYNFLFIKKGPGSKWQKKIIRVVINPGL